MLRFKAALSGKTEKKISADTPPWKMKNAFEERHSSQLNQETGDFGETGFYRAERLSPTSNLTSPHAWIWVCAFCEYVIYSNKQKKKSCYKSKDWVKFFEERRRGSWKVAASLPRDHTSTITPLRVVRTWLFDMTLPASHMSVLFHCFDYRCCLT